MANSLHRCRTFNKQFSLLSSHDLPPLGRCPQKADNKLHKVFEPSFDWKECRTSAFIQQKLNYIHWNPCKGENKIVELPEQYIHSSAKFYITGEQGIYPVTSYTELEDIDLTK